MELLTEEVQFNAYEKGEDIERYLRDLLTFLEEEIYSELVKRLNRLLKITVDNAGNVSISGTLGVTGIATLGDASKMATSAAPGADAQLANKKYVDDTDTATRAYVDALGFVDRGDPAAADFIATDLTTDGTWRDLNLSSIVPAGAKAVLLRVLVADGTVNMYLQLREKGNSNTSNSAICRTQSTTVGNDADVIVACDSNRVIQYLASNITFTTIEINVKGWWI